VTPARAGVSIPGMTRQRRNWVLLWIIILGLANFVCYTVMYWYVQGDAKNGFVEDGHYFVRGHFIHGTQGVAREVRPATWIYSFVHSISIWPTVGAVLVAMFILARPHIIATMKADSPWSGSTFVTVCITIIVLLTGVSTLYFVLTFVDALLTTGRGENWGL